MGIWDVDQVKRTVLAFVAYALLAVAATWPLLADAWCCVYGGTDTPQLNIWALGVVQRQLVRDPSRIFDGNAFYPYSESLAFSEHLFAPALLAAPVAWTTGNLVLAHNAVALLTLALAGLGAFLLALELTGHPWGSAVAGTLYAFHTWNINELVRLQILSNAWFPFLAWALIRYFRSPSLSRLGAVVAFFLLQSLSCMYWLLYMPLFVVPLVLFLAWQKSAARGAVLALLAAFGLATLLLLPFVQPYLRAARHYGFVRASPNSLDLQRNLAVLPGNLLYQDLLGTARANENAAHFLGFGALALAATGLLRGRFAPELSGCRTFLGGLALGGFLLSLGPSIEWNGVELAPGPYRALSRWAPGFQNVRYPERFSILTVFALAPLAAAGLASFGRHGARLGPLAVALVFLEHFSAPLPLSRLPVGADVPPAHRWLAGRSDVSAVAEVPGGHYWTYRNDARAMYLSTFHWQRTLQGYTGYFPPIQNYVRWRLHHFPEPETLDFLEDVGADTLVVNPELAASLNDEWLGRALTTVEFDGGQRILRLARKNRLLAPPEPMSEGLVEIARDGWQLHSATGNAAFAADDDPRTAWTTGEAQSAGDLLFVRLGQPVDVALVSVSVSYPFEFPTRLRIRVRSRGQGWRTVAFDRTHAYGEMFRKLLHAPLEASLDILMNEERVDALRLDVEAPDSFSMPWTVPELRVYTRDPSAPRGSS